MRKIKSWTGCASLRTTIWIGSMQHRLYAPGTLVDYFHIEDYSSYHTALGNSGRVSALSEERSSIEEGTVPPIEVQSSTSLRIEYRYLATHYTQIMTCGIFLLSIFQKYSTRSGVLTVYYIPASSATTEQSGHAEFRSTAYRSYYRSHHYGCSSGYTICRISSLTASWETVHAEVDRLTARLVAI